jgi:hypothetical protein
VRSWLRYAGVAALLTAGVVAATWTWLDPSGRRGILLAAGTALPLQLVLFGLLLGRRAGTPGFLAAWAGGTVLRLLAVGGVGWVVWARDDVDPLSALVGLAGLLFVLLLLEPWGLRAPKTGSTRGSERG